MVDDKVHVFQRLSRVARLAKGDPDVQHIAELEAERDRLKILYKWAMKRMEKAEAERDRLRGALVEVREWARGRNQMLYMLTLEALNKADTKWVEMAEPGQADTK